MPDPNFKYDVFLNNADEDGDWSEKLAKCLRDQNVRVWFDRWEHGAGALPPGQSDQAVRESKRMVSVWSTSYFRDAGARSHAEDFAGHHCARFDEHRLFIPVLIEGCDVPTNLRTIRYIDFRTPDDFSLRFQELLETLDLPYSARPEPEKSFKEKVADIYRLLGYEVKQNYDLSGGQIGMMIERKVDEMPGTVLRAIVMCKDGVIDANDLTQIVEQQKLARKLLPGCQWFVCSQGIVCSQMIAAATQNDVDCIGYTTYRELLRNLVPMERYAEKLIVDYESRIAEKWKGEDWFIRPDLCPDDVDKRLPALEQLMKWLRDERFKFLTVLGDLGTGKTTLLRFLAYNMARSFLDDPLRHPAPVLIPLKEVGKKVSLEAIVIDHFMRRGLGEISFPRFAHLVETGKVIVIFDAFDEMAGLVRWDETRSNFLELRRAADQGGKVVLSCRTHYFKDLTEQEQLIGEEPEPSETDLPREVKQQRNAEVVNLHEFSDDQIRDYLKKGRPNTHEEDWEKISGIHNLQNLAHRPLLLEMIVKTLHGLPEGQPIDAATLYRDYTNLWVEREEEKKRILQRGVKFRLMLELAWELWDRNMPSIHYRELTPFVERLSSEEIVDFGDKEAKDVAREMQGATFLTRDRGGNFSFAHGSFLEYFLARRLMEGLKGTEASVEATLDTRRLGRKVIFFLTQMLETVEILVPLQEILQGPYREKVSENCLQVLYWSGRIGCGMENEIDDPERLREAMVSWLPWGANLQGAALEGIDLQGAVLRNALMGGADLSDAKLNHAAFPEADFHEAKLIGAHCLETLFSHCNLRGANLRNGKFDGADFSEAMMEGVLLEHASFVDAIPPVKGTVLSDQNGARQP